MKLLRFTFKNEAIWMMIFYLGIAILGVLIMLIMLIISFVRN